MSIIDDLRRGCISIWDDHISKELGQKAKGEPYYQNNASAELYLNKYAGRAAAAYYRAILLALQDKALHKPHSSELSKYPERAAALQKHEYERGDYDAFYFTKDNAQRYGLNVSNFYRHMGKLIDLGVIKVIWRYNPNEPMIRKDGSHVNGWIGKSTPRTIYALSDGWAWDEVEKISTKRSDTV